MPTVNVNIPTPPSEAIIDTTVIPFQSLSIDKTKWYRVTDATPVPCIVSGASVGSSSALAFLEGESDGTGIIASGGHGSYDLATGVFAYAFLHDPINEITYIGVDPSSNTNGADCNNIIYQPNATGNINGTDCANITYELNSTANQNGNFSASILYQRGSSNNVNGTGASAINYGISAFNNINGNDANYIVYENGANGNTNGDSCSNIVYGETAQFNTNGNTCNNLNYGIGVINFVFGDNFDFCTINQGLNGNKADNSGPIDFITGVTFLYNRTSPWEIRDIDRTAELIFLYVTYGDGSDPEEGWYDPATDTFTPISSSQVNSDWDAVSGVAEILNKPTIPTTYAETFVRNGQNQTFAAGVTRYLPVVGVAGNTLTVAAQAAQKIVRGGVIPSIGYTLGTSQPGTGSFVVTLMKGSTIAGLADTAAVITIAAGSAAGEYTYTGNITVNSGDYLVWKVVNNASGASGQDFGSWFEIVRTF